MGCTLIRINNKELKSSINKIGTSLVVAGFIASVFSDKIPLFLTVSVSLFGFLIVAVSILEFKEK